MGGIVKVSSGSITNLHARIQQKRRRLEADNDNS
jgi:hypothetical protein